MKILVTGGAGYVGSIIAEWLLQDGHGLDSQDHIIIPARLKNIIRLIRTSYE